MKKILFSGWLLFYAVTGFSQNTFPLTGNVAIGTATPSSVLDPGTNLTINANNSYSSLILQNNGIDRGFFTATASQAILGTVTANTTLQFNTNGLARFLIDNNGYVGIGTSTPLNVLSLRTNANQGLLLTDPNNNNRGALIYDGSQSLLIQALSGPGGADQATMKFQTADIAGLAQTQMVITRDGNIGMGTSEPKSYKLAVNGKIRTQEIKVENTNWPDYVFEKDYALPSLVQIERHIKEKGHLSGIPSAEEVKANGIDLGEMNAKLLRKIEELTLHLIEKDKDLKSIRSDYLVLRKMIIDIKTKKK